MIIRKMAKQNKKKEKCEEMKKMRRLRQAVTVLLCAAMLVTSVPQTGAVVLAAEEEAGLEDTGSSTSVQNTDDTVPSEEKEDTGNENPDADTPGDGVGQDDSVNDSDKQGEDDNSQPGSSEDGEVTDDDDISDTPDENQDENPDGDQDEENAEETETGEDTGDVIDVPEDNAEGTGENDSVSMNALEASANDVAAMSEDGVPEYLGDEQGNYLYIGYHESESDDSFTKADIAAILEYYAGKGRKFTQIYFDMMWTSDGNDMSIDPVIINPALDVLSSSGVISLAFYETDGTNITYHMHGLSKIESKVQTSIEATPIAGKGIKVKYTADGDIPAKVTLDWHKDSVEWDSCLGEEVTEDSELAVFCLDGETLSGRDETCNAFREKSAGDDYVSEWLVINRVNSLQSGAEYLVTPLYDDAEIYGEGSLPVGMTKLLSAGLRSNGVDVKDATWTSMNPEVATFETTSDGSGLLTGVAPGTAYYSVRYTVGGTEYLEVHKIQVSADVDGTELNYVGVIFTDSDGKQYLNIDSYEIYAQNHRTPTNKEVALILKYHESCGHTFDTVYAYLDGTLSQTIGADVANAAASVLAEDGYLHLDFSYSGYIRGFIMHNLGYFSKDIKVTYTETPLANQGIKVKFGASSAIPAESVYFYSHVWDSSKFANYDNSLGTSNGSPAIFKLQSGNPAVKVEECEAEYIAVVQQGETPARKIEISNLNALQLNTEYLLTPLYEDEEPVSAGSTKQLTAGERSGASKVSSVTWKSLDENTVSIDKNGILTAWEAGEAYYYVKYKSGSATYLEVHRVEIAQQEVKIAFDEDRIAMEVWDDENKESRYLRLRFTPSDAECDPGNPDEILWETSKPTVVSLVKYNEQGEEDAAGNPNGEIRAEAAGEATITASYLRDTDGDGTKEKIASATCTVKVTEALTWEDVEADVEAMDLYAVTNLDTKLSDIVIQKKDGTLLTEWAWQEPDTSLANFKDMDGHAFAAVYTKESTGQTFKCNLWVRMVTVTGVDITDVTIMPKSENAEQQEQERRDDVPASITAGDTITFRCGYLINNYNEENSEEYQAISDRMDGRYNIEWTSNPKNAGTASDNIHEYTYTASIAGKKQAAEKKTFTVSMKDKKTNKVLFKYSCNLTVTVNPAYDFDLVEGPWIEDDDDDQMWLCYKVKMPLEEYQKQKLTVVSEDTGVLSLTTKKTVLEQVEESEGSGETEESGKTKVTYTYVRIPCKNPKPGMAWIKITAPDEMKSTRRDCYEFIDKEPKVVGATAVTINKAMNDQTASVIVRTREDWPLVLGSDGNLTDSVLLNKKATQSLQVQAEPVSQEEGSGYCDYKITFSLTEQAAADKNVKNGKNTVALKLTVKPKDAESEENPEQYTLNLTVNVTNTKPSVTFKQTGKVNLFYNDEEGYGVLTVNANGAQLQNLSLEDYEDKNPKKNAACDFELKEGTESGIYYIALKKNGDAKNKKGLLKYKIEGYTETFQSTFTVSSETKKPTIVLSAKSDSLYPNLGYCDSWLTMTNKATGEYIEAASARYVVNKKKDQYTSLNVSEFSDQNDQETLITGNNSFNLLVTPDGNIVSRLQGTDEENPSYSKKADKFNLEIKEANWNDWITVSYSIKVETSNPKLAFGASTLTLNKNSAVYRAQMARTSLRLKGCSNNVMQDDWSWVSIAGQDEKSKKALKVNNSLVLQYWGDCGDIIVKFNNNNIDTGSYKFKITVGNDDAGTIASSVLTVKVVDTSMDKNLKVTAKGSIDVLDREGTYITYTPKLSNLTGVIEDGWLEGRDADLFDAWMEDGKLIVHARDGKTYSTKYSYQVNAVFWVQTQDYDGCEISTAKPLTIKLKQGKPKLKASAVNNTLYRQLDNTVEIKLDAVLNKKEVEIEDVWLLNYTEDLELRTSRIQADNTDDSGEQYYDVIYNPETKSVTLAWRDRYYANSIVQSGKTWKVKLAVRYRDKAGNEKNGEVTCPVVVR